MGSLGTPLLTSIARPGIVALARPASCGDLPVYRDSGICWCPSAVPTKDETPPRGGVLLCLSDGGFLWPSGPHGGTWALYGARRCQPSCGFLWPSGPHGGTADFAGPETVCRQSAPLPSVTRAAASRPLLRLPSFVFHPLSYTRGGGKLAAEQAPSAAMYVAGLYGSVTSSGAARSSDRI